MRRYAIAIVTGISLLYTAMIAGAAPISVVNSKHNLSANGLGTLKSVQTTSGGTGEVCVFCHTPHSSLTDAPLWNRSIPVGSYLTYTSDVLSSLGYAVEDPLNPSAGGYNVHVKTRICMSCHDGTIAMGTLVNYPGDSTTSIPITNALDNKMPDTAAGYMGTDIRDDHPVAVKHNPGSAAGEDPELRVIDSSTNVRVYNVYGGAVKPTQSSGDYVECTSCHDVHNNEFGKFLINDNVGSRLCRSCHNKQGDDSTNNKESVHSNTTYYATGYSAPTGGTPTSLGSTVQLVKCMVCHYPHKAGISTFGGNAPNPGAGKYLLTYQEEMSCYNSRTRWGDDITNCHGSGAVTTKDIKSQVEKVSSGHRVGNFSYFAQPHNATEGSGGAGWVSGNWHVECADCHNAHTAGGELHTTGTNTVSTIQPLYGAGGVDPTWSSGPWTAATTFSYLEPIGVLKSTVSSTTVTKEYQVCMRCHSSFGPNPATMTDQGKEFNTTNLSYHPVVTAKPSNGTLVSPWTSGKTMYCSDCHGSETVGDPGGPHGSTMSHILKRYYTDIYDTTKVLPQPLGELCAMCHDENVYNNPTPGAGADALTGTSFMTTGNINLHNRHKRLANNAVSTYSYRCVNCHAQVPHGYSRRAMIVLQGEGVPYEVSLNGGKIITPEPTLNPSSYGTTTLTSGCATVVGCHR